MSTRLLWSKREEISQGPALHLIFQGENGKLLTTEVKQQKSGLSWELIAPSEESKLFDQLSPWLHAFANQAKAPVLPPLDFTGVTEFTKTILLALAKVPFGEAITYKELAIQAGYQARSARPAGGACGRNPFLILIPCHRILANGGRIGGFTAGLPVKRALLLHEGIEFHE